MEINRKEDLVSTDSTVELTPEGRITRALGRMPYLPMASGYSTSAEPERLAHTLERFADALSWIAEENQAREQELTQLRNDLVAVRRVFGTSS